ncbi:carotenoid oxygenase family protein [Vineibacter terrae]|uniref:Dioxygenase n=1 Tax=Vineibacter terrae TaxID=2586908 RepID=A0A5C8PAJ4_9HYPH|nr:carotenoid oxygenase family protein [Vineibacter terrae]TXL70813.1 carotenoid oxygenase family protein [Vineibacter terrae]
MAKAFPTDEPFLQGFYAPLHMECDAPNLPISGEMPKAICGSLYRNGPNPQFAPRGPYHWFSGDGMVHAFHIENGRVAYLNRWVRTPKWQLENQEGEGLSGAFGNPRYSDPRVVALGSTIANTNIVWHGGRLLALEEAHAPYEMEPRGLASKGYHTFDGKLAGPVTAHPKIDPVSGEMVQFGYAAKGRFTPDLSYQVVDRDGRMRRCDFFQGPYPSMVHDFVVTRRHVIFPIFPLTGSMERAMKGAPPFAWEPDKGTHIGIMMRDGDVSSDIRWFTGDPCYVFHPMNAFDTEDGKVVCDMMKYPVAPLFPRPDGSPSSDKTPSATLVRWTFDLNGNSDTYKEAPLSEHVGEFPRLDERFAMLPYRHGYMQGGNVTDPQNPRASRNGIVHVDLATGRSQIWDPGPIDVAGEPIFVPRRDDAPEGDGWLLAVVYRGAENRSDLVVLDAANVSAGPVATAHLSHRVPAGFHGNWRPGPL